MGTQSSLAGQRSDTYPRAEGPAADGLGRERSMEKHCVQSKVPNENDRGRQTGWEGLPEVPSVDP